MGTYGNGILNSRAKFNLIDRNGDKISPVLPLIIAGGEDLVDL